MSGANKAPNCRFGHFLSRIVVDYADAENIETECRSSMKATFAEYNRKTDRGIKKKCNVINMDVKALYPSMEWEETEKATREMIENSEDTIQKLDWHEVGNYLAVTMSTDEIKREKLEHVIPKRKEETKRKVTINYLCSKKNEEKWKQARTPGSKQKKKMLAITVTGGVRVCMENHVYRVGDKIYL